MQPLRCTCAPSTHAHKHLQQADPFALLRLVLQAGCVWEPEGGDDLPQVCPQEYQAQDTWGGAAAPAAAAPTGVRAHTPAPTTVSGAAVVSTAPSKAAAVPGSVGAAAMPGEGTSAAAGAAPQLSCSSPPRSRPLIVFGDSWQEDGSPLPAPPARSKPAAAAAAGAPSAAGAHTGSMQQDAQLGATQAAGTTEPASAAAAVANPLHAGLAALGRLSAPSQPSTLEAAPPTASASQPPAASSASSIAGPTGPGLAAGAAAAAAARPAAVLSPYALAARAAGRVLWDRMLDMALHDPTMTSDKFKFGSELHRQKVWFFPQTVASTRCSSLKLCAGIESMQSTHMSPCWVCSYTHNWAPSDVCRCCVTCPVFLAPHHHMACCRIQDCEKHTHIPLCWHTFTLQVRLWQALGVLSSFVVVTPGSSTEDLEGVVRSILSTFSPNEAPSVKQYQEAVAAALLLKQVWPAGACNCLRDCLFGSC